MQLHLDKFFEVWDNSAQPYWIVKEGHGVKGSVLARNEEVENMEESKQMLIDFLSAFESGKATIITKTSPHANNTLAKKVYWGDAAPTRGGFTNAGGGMNNQLLMFMMQQSNEQNRLIMQMMQNNTQAIQAEREKVAEMRMQKIMREHEFFKERQQIEAENGGNPWDEAMYGLAGAATPIAQGIAAKLLGVPVAAVAAPQVAAGQVAVGATAAAETDNDTEVEGELGVKGQKEQPAAQKAQRGLSLDRLYIDASGIAKHFPHTAPNEIFRMMRIYLDNNPAMAAMLLQQIQTADA